MRPGQEPQGTHQTQREAPDARLMAPKAWLGARGAWLKAPEASLRASEAWLGGVAGQTDVWTNGRTDAQISLFYRTSPPSGPLPKKQANEQMSGQMSKRAGK